MILRPHICLRCQLRAAKGSTSRVRFGSTESKASTISAPHSSRPARYNDDLSYPAVRRPLHHRLSRRSQVNKLTLASPDVDFYGHLGHKLRDDRERLAIDALGQPAEVIVLRDSKFNYYTHSKVIDGDEQEKVDILQRLESERGLIGQDEVEQNINDFKPKHGEELRTQEEFNNLVESLQKGFTTRQLEQYIKNNSRATSGVERDVDFDKASHAFVRVSSWFPEFVQTTGQLKGDSLRGYLFDSHTAKQGVIIRLLRECWKLSLPALEEGMGQIEVQLRPKDLGFMLRGSQSLLKEISTDHISDEEERIEVFRGRSVIRITAPRTKAQTIIGEIENTIQRISRVEVSVKDLVLIEGEKPSKQSRGHLDEQVDSFTLHELGRMTDTDVVMPFKDRIVISCIKDIDSKVSSRAEVARNLLVASIKPSDPMIHQLKLKHTANDQGAFVKHPVTEGLRWRETLREWSRWVVPIRKDIETPIPGSLLSTANKAKGRSALVQLLNRLSHQKKPVDTNHSNASAYWSPPQNKSYTLLVGSILHRNLNGLSGRLVKMDQKVLTETVQTFSTGVPNLTRFIGSLETKRWKPITSVVLRFLPSPFQHLAPGSKAVGAAAFSAFPPVELSIHLDEQNVLRSKKLQAIYGEEVDDVMLPDRAVDLRFLRRWTSRFYQGDNPNLAKFLSSSAFDMARTHFETPAMISLPMSNQLCKDYGLEESIRGAAVSLDDTVLVDYLVVSIESRKTFPLRFNGWDLLYTSIDAGISSGCRSELKLLPVHENPAISESDFVAAGHHLADVISNPGALPIAKGFDVKGSHWEQAKTIQIDAGTVPDTDIVSLPLEKRPLEGDVDRTENEEAKDELFVDTYL